jgi:hypothetical protein
MALSAEPWPSLTRRCQEFSSAVEGSCRSCDVVVHYSCMSTEEVQTSLGGDYQCDACEAFAKENSAMFEFWRANVGLRAIVLHLNLPRISYPSNHAPKASCITILHACQPVT